MSIARTSCLAGAALSLLSAGCPAMTPEASTPSLSVPSYSSPSFSAPSQPSFSPPSRSSAHADLIVKPDLVCVPFALRAQAPSVKAAMDAAQLLVRTITERFATATGGAALIRMMGFSTQAYSKGKSSRAEDVEYVVLADGAVDVPLGANLDYWAKGKLLSALVEASRALTPSKKEEEPPPGTPRVDAAFTAPEVKVKDPEAHRATLVKRWVERARQFTELSQSRSDPLVILDCAPPGAIGQQPLSIEEVGLSLGIQCRLNATRAERPAGADDKK